MASRYAVIPAHVVAGHDTSFDSLRAALEAATRKAAADGVRRLIVRTHSEVTRDPQPRISVQRIRGVRNGG